MNGRDDKKRCSWVNLQNEKYIKYHDEEWGRPVYDDYRLFEMLVLESFQAGLSWECILKKREAFRAAFDGFDFEKVSAYDEQKVQELLQNEGIVRNRRKIEAAIHNATVFINIREKCETFANYIWQFTSVRVVYETGKTRSELSDRITKDLKKRGMKFIGTTIIYSLLQAVGIVNSHESGCFLCREIMDGESD